MCWKMSFSIVIEYFFWVKYKDLFNWIFLIAICSSTICFFFQAQIKQLMQFSSGHGFNWFTHINVFTVFVCLCKILFKHFYDCGFYNELYTGTIYRARLCYYVITRLFLFFFVWLDIFKIPWLMTSIVVTDACKQKKN